MLAVRQCDRRIACDLRCGFSLRRLGIAQTIDEGDGLVGVGDEGHVEVAVCLSCLKVSKDFGTLLELAAVLALLAVK